MKKQGWESRLFEQIDLARDKPFNLGTHDCSLFVLDCIDAMCDLSLASEWRGTYHDRRTAFDALRDRSGSFDQYFTSHGLENISPKMAGRGDVAYISKRGTIGIVMGTHVVTTNKVGISYIKRSRIIQAWRLPHG